MSPQDYWHYSELNFSTPDVLANHLFDPFPMETDPQAQSESNNSHQDEFSVLITPSLVSTNRVVMGPEPQGRGLPSHNINNDNHEYQGYELSVTIPSGLGSELQKPDAIPQLANEMAGEGGQSRLDDLTSRLLLSTADVPG